MRIPFRRRPASRRYARDSTLCLFTLAALASLSQAITVTPIPSPDLNLDDLGRTGIAGSFNGISLYQWEGQNERPFSSNGSETLMTQFPNGQFYSVLDADASIQTMCTFGGALILGGNFTSLGGQRSTGIAQFNLNTSTLTPLAGLSGQVNSLLCDDNAGMVYLGGSFIAGNSTNAITWIASGSWASLPFAGFNGPVTSITKASNGHIIFGGSFTGLGNTSTPSQSDEQVINLSKATITADGASTASGFSDPENIVCKTGGVDGAGSTWLLEDDSPGTWRAKFNFGFEPTKLRLWNTHQDGRGTKTWRYTALPINGIMNFTYTDPATGQNASCTSECPLSDNSTLTYQDFYFVNQVGMNEFRIDVSAWYGSGGGLDGIELFQNDIYAYAINDFNEPSCAGASFPATATSTGPWVVNPSGQSNSEYLSARLTGNISSDSASVTFFPDIRESGNYTVSMYTPGCIQDNTCLSRGQVQVTSNLTSDGQGSSTTFYQTNNFDKYDGVFNGIIEAASGSFRPSVTITPADGQSISNMTIVAQRVGFVLVKSTGGLNGLFEYDPSKATVDTADFTTSAFDKLGSSFATRSAVASLVANGDVTYIGGNFTSSSVKNIVAINSDSNSTVNLDGGLNGAVSSMYVLDNQLFVGGTFSNTLDASASGLNNVAVYDTSTNKWSPLGAGVNGPVAKVVPITLNITSNTPEDVIALTGTFKSLLAFGDAAETTVDGFAVWVKSQSTWLQFVDGSVPQLDGILTTSLLGLSDGSSLYAGSISSQGLRADGVATMGATLGSFPVDFKPQTGSSSTATSNASVSKRASLINSTDSISGVLAGAFYNSGDSNITILAGHFSASATNGSDITNLVLIDGANGDTVTGLPSGISDESLFLALAVQSNNLFAGGLVNGTIAGSAVNGLISYNLANGNFNTQPPALVGGLGVVSSINVRPNTGDVYVGGSFDAAGSLDCPGVCLFTTSTNQWNRPGLGFEGDVNSMIWKGDSTLIVGGNLTINSSTTYLASYDVASSAWTGFSAASSLPGPVDAVTAANSDGSQIWAAGTQSSGTVYLMKYDGSSWQSSGVSLGADTVISSLQVFSVKTNHDSSSLVDANQVLMITGSLAIPGFGTASSALFNGTTLQPYALSSNTGGAAGSIAKIFVQNQNFFTSSGGGLAVGFVVLIALAISLGLMLLIVVAGLLLDRYRKKRDGYVPAPTSMYDRGSGMRRIPPHELLDSLSKGRSGAPHI
ncbi:cellular morphogenesis protein [Xylariales sp. AK1849]|nr:cellular morphogenesis protein [Xylariales sp. AK1849]